MRGAMDLSHPSQLSQVSTGNWIGSITARTQISTYIGCQHHWRRLSLPRHVGPPPSFFHTFSPLLCCLLCLHFLPVSVPLPSDAVIFFAQVPAAGSWPVILPCISLLQPAPLPLTMAGVMLCKHMCGHIPFLLSVVLQQSSKLATQALNSIQKTCFA